MGHQLQGCCDRVGINEQYYDMLLFSTMGGMLTEKSLQPRYPCVPGIYTEEQVQAWKPIVKVILGMFNSIL